MERVDRYLRQLLLSSSWNRHLMFWLLFFTINTISVARLINNVGGIEAYAGFMVINIVVFYSSYLLYLVAKRFNSVVLFVICLLIGPPVLGAWFAVSWYAFTTKSSAIFYFLNFYAIYVFIAAIAATLKFGKDLYVWQQEEFLRKQEQAESELNFLKAQISPHFLFNTLNNLYGHAVTKSDLLPDMMLRLSDLLRYTIYETSKPLVPLHDELDYIRNYVALEKMRLSQNSNVNFELPDNVDMSLQIAPLLLISFVENAFKHSRHTINHQLHIKGTVVIKNNKLIMEMENSYNPQMKETDLTKREGGVGLENVHKRLRLLYPNKHQLQTDDSNAMYKLKLEIDL